MKIAIVVHGRFHAFDLARELSRRHDVTVFTNYPKWAAKRFGLQSKQLRTFWPHGVATRTAGWLHNNLSIPFPEAAEHRTFGRWAAGQLKRDHWDVVHSFSGISEEILLGTKGHARLWTIVRASAHIRTQAQILEEEERRTGVPLDRPSPWIIAREEREYPLADRIVVLSTFAYNSMLAEGVDADRLRKVPLGARLDQFRPSPQVVEDRCSRILAHEPLRVLFVGAVTFQKGMWDSASVIRSAQGERLRFRFVGAVSPETKTLVDSLRPLAEFVPKQSEPELPTSYAWGDVFVLPTIQDGFPVVLAQAHAAALPILTTPNCCGPDVIHAGRNGWVLPIRSPQAFLDQLLWCDSHRPELADMVRNIYQHFQPRTWAQVAVDFESVWTEALQHNHADPILTAR